MNTFILENLTARDLPLMFFPTEVMCLEASNTCKRARNIFIVKKASIINVVCPLLFYKIFF